MRGDFFERPTYEGIFGPEILINTISGVGCLRLDDGRVIGPLPKLPLTNAFAIWLGRPIVVVSEGVQIENVSQVAEGLREILGETHVPVVFSLGRVVGQKYVSAMTDTAAPYAERELARAAAYALVQAGLVEAEKIIIELDGQPFEFRVEFRPGSGGPFMPAVR